MSILCLTGWQQRSDELVAIVPADAIHLNYASCNNVAAVFQNLPPDPKIAIGWSLGGQLLVRAVAEKYIKPEVLVLLGAPYQYIANEHFLRGVHNDGFKEFRDNYSKDAAATLKQFNALAGLGDNRVMRVIRALNNRSEIWNNGLFWLDELSKASFCDLDFTSFPKTIIVHGQNDKVIDAASADMFLRHIPQSQLLLWPDCGHAPHLHNPDALRALINEHV